MKKRKLLLFMLASAAFSSGSAAFYHLNSIKDTNGNLDSRLQLINVLSDEENQNYVITERGLKALVGDVISEVTFYSPSIVRVEKYNINEDVTKHNLVVTLTPEDISFNTIEDENVITLVSEETKVEFNKLNGQIIFYDKAGNPTLCEKQDAYMMTERKDGDFDSYRVSQTFTLQDEEQIYGLGQLMNGDLSQRGKSYWDMIQGNMSVWVPYIHSVKGYALYWDNYSPTNFTDNNNGMTFESAVGYGVNYYYLGGSKEKGDKTVAQMRKLSGKAPMIPLWSYGYFQSKERYQSADETMSVVKKYRDLGVPLDCIVQDWQYWGGNNQWNAMEFLNPTFNNYQQMIDSVHNMGAKIIISFWANFGPDTKQFAHFRDMNALFKNGDNIMTDTYPSNEGVAIYDTYNSEARDYYWQCLLDGLTSKGIDAYWMDSSEPDHYEAPDEREKTFNFVTGLGTTWRSVRNAFPLVHVGSVYDKHRAESTCNHKRATILTRSAFAGQQRYGANTWSGDITANWETLAAQIPAALNFTMCGIPNWNSDIGGFFNGDYSGAGEDSYNELYLRWIQFGTFCTMMRSHGAGSDRAIYRFGERGTLYFDVIEKYINFRYALLPYIYSTSWNVSENDASFMRALPLAYPSDKNTHLIKHDFMFGESLLVSPVIEAGAKTRSVYLPEGNDWLDLWTGEKYEGGSTIDKKVNLQTMPLFVKAGSIIPWGPKVQYSTEQKWDNLEVRIYPGADAEFTLYEDEFDTYNYENGKYSEIKFTWNDNNQTLTIGNIKGSFDNMIGNRKFSVVLVDNETGLGTEQSKLISKIVEYNGSEVTVKIDNNNLTEMEDSVLEEEINFAATVENFPLNDGSKTSFWYGGLTETYNPETQTLIFGGNYQQWGWGFGDFARNMEGQIVTSDTDLDVSDYKYLVANFKHIDNLIAFRIEYFDSANILHNNEETDGNGNKNPDERIQFMMGANEENYSFMKNSDDSYTVKVNLQALDVQRIIKVYLWNTWEKADNRIEIENVYLTNSTNYSINIIPDQYQTICIPRNMVCKTDDAEFYNVKGADSKENPSKLYLEGNKSELQAGIPYIFRSSSSVIYFDLKETYVEEINAVNGLTGNFADTEVASDSKIYRLKDDKLTNIPDGFINNAYSAYLDLKETPVYNGTSNEPVIYFASGTTAINKVTTDENAIVDVYSVMGIKLRSNVIYKEVIMELPAGIYIINGKKVVVNN